MISILGAALVAGALGLELAGRRGQFTAAVRAAPIWILSLVVLLQLVALIARTEAWRSRAPQCSDSVASRTAARLDSGPALR